MRVLLCDGVRIDPDLSVVSKDLIFGESTVFFLNE